MQKHQLLLQNDKLAASSDINLQMTCSWLKLKKTACNILEDLPPVIFLHICNFDIFHEANTHTNVISENKSRAIKKQHIGAFEVSAHQIIKRVALALSTSFTHFTKVFV